MNIAHNTDLLDRLAASYALGTLRGGARRRFEALARDHATVRAAALVWQARWSGLVECQAPAAVPAAVWTRIDNLVQAEMAQTEMAQAALQARAAKGSAEPGWADRWRSLWLWRGAAAAGALATLAAVVIGIQVQDRLEGQLQAQVRLSRDAQAAQSTQIAALRQQLEATPQIQYVAVLADDKAAASMLVTFDPRSNQLVLQRVGGFHEGENQSLQLWALPPSGGPRSLGVLGQDRLINLRAGAADVQQVPVLAISLEPKGGVPGEGGPTGPVLFKGELIQRML